MRQVVKTSGEAIDIISNSAEQGNSFITLPLAELPEVVAGIPQAFTDDFLTVWQVSKSKALDGYHYSIIDEAFAIEGTSSLDLLVTLFVQGDDDAPVCVRVDSLMQVVAIGGNYYRPYRCASKRYGMSRVAAAENVRRCNYEGQPHYFSAPSAKSLTAWALWLEGCEAENVEEIERVRRLHDDTRTAIERSGLPHRDTARGMSVSAGPVTIWVEFADSGVYYRYEVNNGAIGYGADAFAALLTMFGNKCEQPQQEQPKKEQPKNAAYRVFRSLAVEMVEGREQWTAQAREVMQRGNVCGNAVAEDICRRALSGNTRLSDRQRWCVAYAVTRAAQ